MSTDYYAQENLVNARKSGKYSEVMASLKKCPFCDLKSKYFVLEKSKVVLTVNLFPYIDGHMLIIPKRHIETFGDITALEWKQINELVSVAEKVLKERFNIPGYNFLYRQGNISGSSLGHVHFHIIPTPKIILVPEYQQINVTPLDLAEQLRNLCNNTTQKRKKN